MTRAKETLTLFELAGRPNPFSSPLSAGRAVVRPPRSSFPPHDQALERRVVFLGLRDVDIGYAGRAVRPRVREAIRELEVGAALRLRPVTRELLNERGEIVGKLSKAFALPEGVIDWVRVTAIVHRTREQVPEPNYRAMCKVEEWETVLAALAIVPEGVARVIERERVATAR